MLDGDDDHAAIVSINGLALPELQGLVQQLSGLLPATNLVLAEFRAWEQLLVENKHRTTDLA